MIIEADAVASGIPAGWSVAHNRAMDPAPESLTHLPDEQLRALARHWRLQAQRGDRQAFGIAHLLEAEARRHQRESLLQSLPAPMPTAPPRPWWKFWRMRGVAPRP